MRRLWGIVVVVGLACSLRVASLGQDTGSSPQTMPADTKRQTPEQEKNASAAKSEFSTDPTRNDSATAEAKPDAKDRSDVVKKKPRKVIVREGGAKEPTAQIVTGMTAEKASNEQHEAERWLNSAEGDLKLIAGRTLDAQQQDMVAEIHNYMGIARSALSEGDISRGHTLAMKARLLAEDLVKH